MNTGKARFNHGYPGCIKRVICLASLLSFSKSCLPLGCKPRDSVMYPPRPPCDLWPWWVCLRTHQMPWRTRNAVMATGIINHQSPHTVPRATWPYGPKERRPSALRSTSCHHLHKADAFEPFHRSNELLQDSWSHGHLPLFPAWWLKRWREDIFIWLCDLMSPLLKARTASLSW